MTSNTPPAASGRMIVIVIDDLHIIESELPAFRRVLDQLVDASTPDDRLAIVYVGRSDLSQDFTANRRLLSSAVANLSQSMITGFSYDSSKGPLVGVYPDDLNGARATWFTLNNVIGSLETIPNRRRVVIYASSQGAGRAGPRGVRGRPVRSR